MARAVLRLDRRAVERVGLHSPAAARVVRIVARALEQAAERNAAALSSHAKGGLATVTGHDARSVHADVGYDKTTRGWHLFFFEIGTSRMPARPHLRVALHQRITF